jgi:hypothetical protein
MRHRAVTVLADALCLEIFQPVPNRLTYFVDGGGDDYRTLNEAWSDFDDTGSQVRRIRLKPNSEHERPGIPADWGGPGRDWVQGSVSHKDLPAPELIVRGEQVKRFLRNLTPLPDPATARIHIS